MKKKRLFLHRSFKKVNLKLSFFACTHNGQVYSATLYIWKRIGTLYLEFYFVIVFY